MKHLRMALCAMQNAGLDRVLMLPSGNPPHKQGITPAEDRWRMLCAACANHPGLEPCREEIDRTGVIYTVDTLSILHEKYPKAELFYIIGAATLMELHKWRSFETVLTLCTFLICPRSWNYTPQQLTEERKRLTALGGSFVLACDVLARLLFAPFEFPVGIVMSLLGGPFFLHLLMRRKRSRVYD